MTDALLSQAVLARLELTGDILLEACFTPEEVPRHTKASVTEAVAKLLQEDASLDLQPGPNMHAVRDGGGQFGKGSPSEKAGQSCCMGYKDTLCFML